MRTHTRDYEDFYPTPPGKSTQGLGQNWAKSRVNIPDAWKQNPGRQLHPESNAINNHK